MEVLRKFFVFDKAAGEHKEIVGVEALKALTGYDAPELPIHKVTVGDNEDFIIHEMKIKQL